MNRPRVVLTRSGIVENQLQLARAGIAKIDAQIARTGQRGGEQKSTVGQRVGSAAATERRQMHAMRGSPELNRRRAGKNRPQGIDGVTATLRVDQRGPSSVRARTVPSGISVACP